MQVNVGRRHVTPHAGNRPEIIKMFYNCGGERQTFACRLLMPINAGLPPSSEGLPLSCEGSPPSSVL